MKRRSFFALALAPVAIPLAKLLPKATPKVYPDILAQQFLHTEYAMGIQIQRKLWNSEANSAFADLADTSSEQCQLDAINLFNSAT